MEEEKEKLKQEIKQELKKEMIKQQIIFILCIVVIGIVIFTINRPKQNNYKNNNNTSSYSQDNKQVKGISKEEFKKYIKQVDITTENWKDYFEVTEETKESKNSFGDVTATDSYITFKLNDKYYDIGELYNTSLEIEIPKEKAPNIAGKIHNKRILDFYNKKATLSKPELFGNDKETITLNEIKCIRATGILYYLDNIPKEYWNIADDTIEGSNEYINIDGQCYFKGNLNLKDFVEN